MQSLQPRQGDALIIVDLQYDFLPGGSLAVTDGDAVIPVLNQLIKAFEATALPIVATRDWHPDKHCSFLPQGGIWPPHCIAGSHGAAFADGLQLGRASVVSKATSVERDAYSGFEGTALGATLHAQGVRRVFVGGLATDYCVLQTVLDAFKLGFEVVLLTDAIRAVDVQAGDGARAIARMIDGGAHAARLDDLIAASASVSAAA